MMTGEMNVVDTYDRVKEIVDYLENKGLQPEYVKHKVRFHHPQRLSRAVLLQQTDDNAAVSITFSNPIPAFSDAWNLSPTGELPLNYPKDTVQKALDAFFKIAITNPPAGSAPFLTCLRNVMGIIQRCAHKFHHAHYELSYRDLISIGAVKTHELWLRFGDRPKKEFQCLVACSIQRQFNSLLIKHYRCQKRGGMTVTPLTEELEDTLAAPITEEIVDKEHWDEYLATLTLAERALLKTLIEPSDSLRRDLQLDLLRYRRVKMQAPKSRIPMPRYTFSKISLATAIPETELRASHQRLSQLFPTKAWEELID